MTTSEKLSFWYCNNCNRTLNHGEFRYNCTTCDDYDYCERCAKTVDPPHPHRMVPELAYGRAEKKKCRIKDMMTIIQTAIDKYWDRYCMGIRDVDKENPAIYMDSYSWFTFKNIGDRSKNFGHGLRRLIEPRGYLGICAENRPEWMITDFACIFQSIISVPIYTLFNKNEIAYVINNTQVSVIVCDKQLLPKFIDIHEQCSSLQHIVCMDPIPDTISTITKEQGISIHYMKDIENYGSTNQYDYVNTKPADCFTILYTSGSSGFPKGTMVSENAFRAAFPQRFPSLSSSVDYINFSYRPLAWAADRDAIIITFLHGGRTGFSTGDPSRLMEELALVRPSDFAAAPSFWNKIYTEFKTSLALITAHSPPETIADEEQCLLQQFSKLIPNRCKIITVGGAMVSPVVMNFMKQCFTHCSVYESYGITECGSVTYNNLVENSLQYRLESVPEMGYTVEDEPFPRGELLTKTPQMFSGYINNPEETSAALTEDGFFRTGDIVELCTSRNGQINIHVIDRKKNFFKLAQGQFISPEFLQNIYIQSPFVEQIYIHGDLLSDSVSAVIVPNQKYAQVYAIEHNLIDFNINNPHPELINAILQDLHSIGEKESLRKYEIPSKIIIDFEPFTSQNGLLTSSMKPCRHKLAAHYANQLKIPNTIEQRLKTIIENVTGRSISIDNKEENVFLSIGGDSLAAIRLSRMIENDLGISLSFNILFDPKMNLERLTTYIQNPSQFSSFSQSILSQMLNDSQLDFNIKVEKHKSIIDFPSMVLITGTTGFVGAFLLAELLTIYPIKCKFVCLVRCQSSINGLDRIRKNMLFYQIWKDDYEERIIPLQGDLSQNNFGLDKETYQSFVHQIDIIFHCGAIVNFILPYNQLYGSNVCGTREIIRFATHIPSSCIPIQYISTISVLPFDIDKEISIDETSPEQLIGGYAQSKWVAEKLITKANHSGLLVNIYRLGLICADSRTGACNQHDIYTLLITAMMKMNCYPKSLTECHLNGLSVDFTAKTIVYLSNLKSNVYGNIYHMINRNSEIKFVDIIDGMHTCGIELESVSYNEWKMKMKRFNDQNNPLESVSEFFSKSAFSERSLISADQFYGAVCALDFPSFDKDYICKWLSFIMHNIVRK
ncbi:unnamed protein product [Rotaria sordida]|uniref:long-chain-fatty-acid--CoA ligase n=1 Tax=Rotaria sordida TaxID=392033 RepID=A0A814CJA9_9BILA|nr:unnamed protein product [Rotaria sordida]CAF3781155.1 unnamed protein product [Rotaria sordida]